MSGKRAGKFRFQRTAIRHFSRELLGKPFVRQLHEVPVGIPHVN